MKGAPGLSLGKQGNTGNFGEGKYFFVGRKSGKIFHSRRCCSSSSLLRRRRRGRLHPVQLPPDDLRARRRRLLLLFHGEVERLHLVPPDLLLLLQQPEQLAVLLLPVLVQPRPGQHRRPPFLLPHLDLHLALPFLPRPLRAGLLRWGRGRGSNARPVHFPIY